MSTLAQPDDQISTHFVISQMDCKSNYKTATKLVNLDPLIERPLQLLVAVKRRTSFFHPNIIHPVLIIICRARADPYFFLSRFATTIRGPGLRYYLLILRGGAAPQVLDARKSLDWCCQPLIQWTFKVTLKIMGRWRALSRPVQNFHPPAEERQLPESNDKFRVLIFRGGLTVVTETGNECHINRMRQALSVHANDWPFENSTQCPSSLSNDEALRKVTNIRVVHTGLLFHFLCDILHPHPVFNTATGKILKTQHNLILSNYASYPSFSPYLTSSHSWCWSILFISLKILNYRMFTVQYLISNNQRK